MVLEIDYMQPTDWARVRAIYNEGLASGLAAFQSRAPIWKRWSKTHPANARFVARCDGVVVGC